MKNEDRKATVRTFFEGVSAGAVDDGILADGMTFWSVNSGESDRARFQGGIQLLAKIANQSIRYDIVNLTSEGDRTVAEIESQGTLVNGEPLANVHVFIFVWQGQKIASVKEFMNQKVVAEKIAPLMQELMANQPG